MSIELKQAAQQAIEALEWYVENDDVVESMPGNEFWVGGKREAEKAIQELRTAIQQAESEPVGAREALERIASWSEHPAMLGVDYGSNGVRDYYRKIASDALTHPAPGVPDALKDHQIAAMVNTLRDIARQFHGHDSLRERIANVLVPALKAEANADEPVAWIRRHPNGALSNELLIHVQVEQVRRDSGAWVPLYTHPAPGVPDDAKRLNWLNDTNKRFRMGWEVGQAPAGNVSIRTIITGGKSIRDAIDAAMLAASPAQKGGE